jgi:hypothetical protein
MTAQDIRESSSHLVEKWLAVGKDLQPVAVQSGIYAALVEIAAQLADMNERDRRAAEENSARGIRALDDLRGGSR